MKNILEYIKKNSDDIKVENFFYQIGGKNWHIDQRVIDNNMLVFCIGGKGEYLVENESFEIKKSRIIFISHSVLHSSRQNEDKPVQVLALRFSFKNNKRMPKGSFCFDSNNFSTLNNIFSKIGKHLLCGDDDNKSIANRMLNSFFLMLESEIIAYKNKVYDEYLENLNFLIEKSISLNKNIDLENFYSHYGSKYKFTKAFKNYYNMTYKSYCFYKKIEYIKMLLEETNLSISEISERTAYSDPYILSNQFKKTYNISPKEYRNKLHLLE